LIAEARRSILEIKPRELRAWVRQGAQLIDLREPEEFEQGHLQGAIRVDRTKLAPVIDRLVPDFGKAIVCCSAHGHRSALAAYQLQQLGYQRVASLRGGLERWDRQRDIGRLRPSDESIGP
jgi:rhodanese-related sulfurtransferase